MKLHRSHFFAFFIIIKAGVKGNYHIKDVAGTLTKMCNNVESNNFVSILRQLTLIVIHLAVGTETSNNHF